MTRISHKFFAGVIGVSLCIFFGGVYVLALSEPVKLSGIFGNKHQTGFFDLNGNAGMIDFGAQPVFPATVIDNPQIANGESNCSSTPPSKLVLTGTFWMETVGWVTFADVGAGPICVIPPAGDENIRTPWTLSGYAWSKNAGWIALRHGDASASGVTYLPDTASFTGFAWSDTLGWIPFSSGSEAKKGFIGQVKAIGNIGGSKIFDVLGTSPGQAFDTQTLNNILNTIKKNIALLTRNAGTKINTDTSTKNVFQDATIYRFDSTDEPIIKYSDLKSQFGTYDTIRSIIVIGGHILIDEDFVPNITQTKSVSIITLQNDLGKGGDIYIKGNVKKIQANLIAEKSLYSADIYNAAKSLYYTNKASAFLDLPPNQLYIQGSILSHNTIGGGSRDGDPVCPYSASESVCSYDAALTYDLNYFRSFRNQDITHRAYKDTSLDDYSTIIEYDPRILSDPPPGLADIR